MNSFRDSCRTILHCDNRPTLMSESSKENSIRQFREKVGFHDKRFMKKKCLNFISI